VVEVVLQIALGSVSYVSNRAKSIVQNNTIYNSFLFWAMLIVAVQQLQQIFPKVLSFIYTKSA
jgi:hypothetical protein